MAQIAVVTDSAACIPVNLARECRIQVIPLELVWEGRRYRDGLDITPADFYRRLRQSSAWPTTSVPSLGTFVNLYAQLSDEAQDIVSIHVAAELSGTYQVARLAAEQAAPGRVHTIDSRTGAIAEGFVVLAAARVAAAGGSLQDVVNAAETAKNRVGLFITMQTLEYLHRGGRIGEAAALLGSRLHIYPVLYLAEGRVKVAGATRSRRKAMERILAFVAERADERLKCASVFHADAPQEELTWMETETRARFACEEFFVTEFTPVMGAHTGPGTIGVGFWY